MANGHEADPRFKPGRSGRGFMADWARDLWLRRDPFVACWVAVDDALDGFVTAYVESPSPVMDEAQVMRIGDLWVEPHARGNGLGRALVDAAIGGAADAGYVDVIVGTLGNDARAVGFWRAMGFGDWRITLRR